MQNGNGRRRVVITGMGTLNPLGNTVDEFWQGAVAGNSGVGWLTQVESEGYDDAHRRRSEELRAGRLHRPQRGTADGALLATRAGGRERGGRAVAARPDDSRPYRIGVIFGNGMGGYPDTDRAVKDIVRKGGTRVDPFYMVKMLPNMAAAQVAMRYGAKGYNATIITACASAGNAMGEALEMIRTGRADVMITGGTEAGLSELGLAAFQVMRALSTQNDPPERASRPFDCEARRLRLRRKARRCSSSSRWSTRRSAAPGYSPSSPATAARRTRTTSSCRSRTARRRRAR